MRSLVIFLDLSGPRLICARQLRTIENSSSGIGLVHILSGVLPFRQVPFGVLVRCQASVRVYSRCDLCVGMGKAGKTRLKTGFDIWPVEPAETQG